MQLETQRLILRPIRLDDKYEIFTYRSDRETNKFQGWIPETIEDVETFIGNLSKQIDEPDSWFQFVLIEKDSKKIIGDLGIYFFDKENEQAEIGCTLNKEAQNKGYATESLNRIIDYLFKELHKYRITASVDPGNINSIRLLERLGFSKEARLVESLFLNGKWVDDLIYALTINDRPEYVSEFIFEEPVQWGLRGDPFFWKELKVRFENANIQSKEEFSDMLTCVFEEVTGKRLQKRETYFVPTYKFYGMSAGMLSGDFWIEHGFPLLLERFGKIQL